MPDASSTPVSGGARGRPVYVHIGLKKTGTSYLQTTFRASRQQLADQGLTMVPGSQPASHQLTLAVREQEGVRHGDPLERLPRQLAEAKGDRLLISEESLSTAEPHQILRLREALDGFEVHLVVTVRDIARTIPSAWQQTVKAGRQHAYADFVDAVTSGVEAAGSVGFWRSQGVVEVLERFQPLVDGPERTHLVVVPGPGAPKDLLLQRFCSVVGVDPEPLARDVARVNESLGLEQAELLRRVNAEVDGRFGRVPYGAVFKRYFALRVLVPQGGRRPLLPAAHRAWCEQHAVETIEALRATDYDVVGDLDDLTPSAQAFTDDDLAVADAEVADSAVHALARVLADRIEAEEKPEETRPERGRAGGPAQTAPDATRATGPARSAGSARRLAGLVKRRLARLRSR